MLDKIGDGVEDSAIDPPETHGAIDPPETQPGVSGAVEQGAIDPPETGTGQ